MNCYDRFHAYLAGRVVIFDYDGTLSCGNHRLNLLPQIDQHINQTWDEFNLACDKDDPIMATIQVMNAMYAAGYFVIILTGRGEIAREKSLAWLNAHGCKYDHLEMRKSDDHRKDTEFKESVLRDIGLHRIVACWDDNINITRHLRSLGLTVYLVTEYEDNERHDLKNHGVNPKKYDREYTCTSTLEDFYFINGRKYDGNTACVLSNFGVEHKIWMTAKCFYVRDEDGLIIAKFSLNVKA